MTPRHLILYITVKSRAKDTTHMIAFVSSLLYKSDMIWYCLLLLVNVRTDSVPSCVVPANSSFKMFARFLPLLMRMYNEYLNNSDQLFNFIMNGTVTAKIAPRLKCYKNASRLNRYNFPTDNTIVFLSFKTSYYTISL